jgi:hypothetical protein
MKTTLAFAVVILSLLLTWLLRPSETVTWFQDVASDLRGATQHTQRAEREDPQIAPPSTAAAPEPRLPRLWSLDPPRPLTLLSQVTPVEEKTIRAEDPATKMLEVSKPISQPPTAPLSSVAGWANSNLPAAITWAASLPEGENKDAAIVTLGFEAARNEPTAAIELARSLPPNRERNALLDHALNQWAASDPAAAHAWVTQIEDPELHQKLIADLAIASAENDAPNAAALAANSIPPGEDQDRVAVAIVQRWVQKAPLDAAAWVTQFPDSSARDAALQNLVTLWTTQDSHAALNWLQQLPEGNLRSLALNTYSQTLARPNPAVVTSSSVPVLEVPETN